MLHRLQKTTEKMKKKNMSRIPAIARKNKKRQKNYSGMYMSHEYVHIVAHNSAHLGKKKKKEKKLE